MNIKSLMIGDWVYDTLSQTNIKVNGGCFEINPLNGICYAENLIPIPLTPEILEKNGWIKTKFGYGRDCMVIDGADELPEGVDNALSMARWSIDKNYQYHFLDLYMWKGSVMKHDVHYVHQLQQAMRIMGCDKEIEL